MPYTKTDWDETTAITDARLNNQEDGIADVEGYVDAQVAIANTNISNAKTPLASAITAKGVATSSSDTFIQMATNIAQINPIKNIQIIDWNIGSWNTGATGTEFNITIPTSVNTSKSIIRASFVRNTYNGELRGAQVEFRFNFVNSTTILAKRGLDPSFSDERNLVIHWILEVIEFEDFVNVISGQYTSLAKEINLTLSSIDKSKSLVTASSYKTVNSSGYDFSNTVAYMSTNTNLKIYNEEFLQYIQYYVVEYK